MPEERVGQPHENSWKAWIARVLAIFEILLGAGFLYWSCRYGVHDDSSMGSGVLLWGSVAALFALLIPGMVLLFSRTDRWGSQIFPALLAAFYFVGVIVNLFR
jgi:hypothetical protein